MNDAPAAPNPPAHLGKTYELKGKQLQEIEARFGERPVNAEQLDRIRDIQREFKKLALFVGTHTPPSREQALALTALDEGCRWAVNAITRNEEAYPGEPPF